MTKKSKLNGVEDTLYIPLVARIYAHEKFPDFFRDERAGALKRDIPENSIHKNAMEYFHMASVCRQQTIDTLILKFLNAQRKCNIVFLGAGLDPAYDRIRNREANFFQVDLPEVIAIRKRLLGHASNERLLSGDMFALDWIKAMDCSLPTMITVAGVYQYFKTDDVIAMIRMMKRLIPGGELVFDATNAKGLKVANQYVRRTGNTGAPMYFSVDDPEAFAARTDTELIAVTGFFGDALKKCCGLKFKTRIFMFFADRLHRTKIIHLRFRSDLKD